MAVEPGSARVGLDDCRLHERLCFAFYSAKPVLDGLGLTFTQYIAIIILSGGRLARERSQTAWAAVLMRRADEMAGSPPPWRV